MCRGWVLIFLAGGCRWGLAAVDSAARVSAADAELALDCSGIFLGPAVAAALVLLAHRAAAPGAGWMVVGHGLIAYRGLRFRAKSDSVSRIRIMGTASGDGWGHALTAGRCQASPIR